MPNYEYRCRNCEYKFERLQHIDDANPRCPLCRCESDKLISAGNFKLKGSGFHCNDYTKFSSK